jgi:hypothetical protein
MSSIHARTVWFQFGGDQGVVDVHVSAQITADDDIVTCGEGMF